MARFTDNTKARPVDRKRVYGFAPGLKYMPLRGLVAGISEIPQGTMVLFKPRVETYLDAQYRVATQEFSALQQAQTVRAKYVGGAAGDTGFRVLEMLTDLDYDKETGWDAADEYFAVVHPNYIGTCEMGLETNVGSTDSAYPRANLNERSDPCPTCRLKWLNSRKCLEAIKASELDQDILEKLRLRLIDSYMAGRNFAQRKFNESEGEIKSRAAGAQTGKPAFDESDYHFMAMIHKKDPVIEQAELVTKQAEVQGRVQAEALREVLASALPKGEDKVAKLEKELEELKALLKESLTKKK